MYLKIVVVALSIVVIVVAVIAFTQMIRSNKKGGPQE